MSTTVELEGTDDVWHDFARAAKGDISFHGPLQQHPKAPYHDLRDVAEGPAEHVDVSRQTISAIENSRHTPLVDVALCITDALGVCVEDMLSLEPGIDNDTENGERLIISVGIDDEPDP